MNKKIFLLVGALLATMSFANICSNPHNATENGWTIDYPPNTGDKFKFDWASYNTQNSTLFCEFTDENRGVQTRIWKKMNADITYFEAYITVRYNGIETHVKPWIHEGNDYKCTRSLEECTLRVYK